MKSQSIYSQHLGNNGTSDCTDLTAFGGRGPQKKKKKEIIEGKVSDFFLVNVNFHLDKHL